jgi:uncharacterized protein YlxP (DUF503 family)
MDNKQPDFNQYTDQQLQSMLGEAAIAEVINLNNKKMVMKELLARQQNQTEITGSLNHETNIV